MIPIIPKTASTEKQERVTEREDSVRYHLASADFTFLPAIKWTPSDIKAYMTAALQ